VETDKELVASGKYYFFLHFFFFCRGSDKPLADVQGEIQAVIRQITSAVTYLPQISGTGINLTYTLMFCS
jgi:hypothetical protein